MVDPVGDRGVAFVVVSVPDLGHFGGEADLELVLEAGDAVEDGAGGRFVAAVVVERVLDQDLAQLLHERVGLAGGVVDVGEHGLVVDDAEKILFGEAGREERAVGGVHEERLLRHLCNDVLHGGLHGFLEVAEVDGLAEGDEEGGGHELEDLDGFLGLARGD